MFSVALRNGPQLVTGRYGTFAFYPNDMIGRLFATYGEWAEQEFALMRTLLGAGDIVLDVGAHIGTLTVPLARTVGANGRVIAFEAQRKIFHNLCANIYLNGLLNVVAHNCLVGERSGDVLITDTPWHEVRNSGGTSYAAGIPEGRRFDSTPRYKIDDVLSGLPRLRLVKMDIEGSEPAALRGMQQTITRHRPVMYIEANTPERFHQVREVVTAFDYDVFWHAEPHWNPNNFFRNPQNLYGDKSDINVICFPKGTERPVNLKIASDFAEVAHLVS